MRCGKRKTGINGSSLRRENCEGMSSETGYMVKLVESLHDTCHESKEDAHHSHKAQSASRITTDAKNRKRL